MKSTHFIARHLNKADIEKPIVDGNCICKLCGDEFEKGVSKMITEKFTDTAYFQFPESDLLCLDCAVCLGKIMHPESGKKTFFRNFSFICNNDSLDFLKREDIMAKLISPPEPPFILCVTYSNKKHMSFKSKIQVDKNRYIVTTDIGDISVDIEAIKDILGAIQNWYTVIPEKAKTAAQLTYFTKDDILNGCRNYKKIEEYGIEKYFAENQKIETWRNTSLLKLLVFCLNKGGLN